jgi:hypothetical protein
MIIHSFIHSFIHLFTSQTDLFIIRLLIHLFIPFIDWLIYLFIYLLTNTSLINPLKTQRICFI